jgi:hypothetical protein
MSQKNIGVVAEMAKTASENSKAREHESKRQTAMTILMDSAQYSKSPQELIAYRLELEQHPLGVLDSLVKATKMINKNSVDRKQKALELVRLRNEVAKEYADDVSYLGNIDDMSLEELDRWIAHYRSAKTRHATDKKQKEEDELKALKFQIIGIAAKECSMEELPTVLKAIDDLSPQQMKELAKENPASWRTTLLKGAQVALGGVAVVNPIAGVAAYGVGVLVTMSEKSDSEKTTDPSKG